MCCLFTSLLLFGPRLAILIWWLISPLYVQLAFDNWLWPILGWIFLPWTTLMYIAIYPGGIIGFDWIFMGLAIFADMAGYFGGFRERERVPYGSQIRY
jgi:hypothetical protein